MHEMVRIVYKLILGIIIVHIHPYGCEKIRKIPKNLTKTRLEHGGSALQGTTIHNPWCAQRAMVGSIVYILRKKI